jgi:hypothetical protein
MKSKQSEASTLGALGNERYCMKSLDNNRHLQKVSKLLPDSVLDLGKGSENSADLAELYEWMRI